ncbi:MAG: hypothetical protein AB7T49_16275 [Oligoflexales bacterium]
MDNRRGFIGRLLFASLVYAIAIVAPIHADEYRSTKIVKPDFGDMKEVKPLSRPQPFQNLQRYSGKKLALPPKQKETKAPEVPPVVNNVSPVYDLGGPCVPSGDVSSILEGMRKEKKTLDERIEGLRLAIRQQCSEAYLWRNLADTYLEKGDHVQTILVLHEMYNRGFEIKPTELSSKVAEFLKHPVFKQSEVGKLLEKDLLQVEERRLQYRNKLGTMAKGSVPANPYIAENVCPFECCTYGTWEVVANAQLVEKPQGKEELGAVSIGEKVQTTTGTLYIEPVPIGVALSKDGFVKGDVFFLLDYMGEGYSHYLYNGKIGEIELIEASYCLRPNKHCWAELVDNTHRDLMDRFSEWWVKAKKSNGREGWAKGDIFTGGDACGH